MGYAKNDILSKMLDSTLLELESSEEILSSETAKKKVDSLRLICNEFIKELDISRTEYLTLLGLVWENEKRLNEERPSGERLEEKY